ncbi:hypothetical protein COCNU_scaffold003053G000020 [Cocos nucifera]|nr:hypothetical protein [Cocos nucifera]
MDAQATKMPTKGLFTRKRKGKVQEDGSKRAKIDVSSSEVPTPTAAASEVIIGIEIAPTIEVDTASMGLVPSMPSGPSSGDQVLELLVRKGIEEGRKKKAIAKMSCKARLGGLDGKDNEQGEDPFDNLEIIRDLAIECIFPTFGIRAVLHGRKEDT